MRLLFISWWWPYPADNGSKIRIYNLLRQLAAVYDVSLLSFAEAGEATPERIAHLRTFCAHVEAFTKPHYQPHDLKAMLGYFSRWPRSLVNVYSPEMGARVRALLPAVDVAVASQIQTMRYLEFAPRAILEEFEITSFQNRVVQAHNAALHFRAQLTLSKLENSLHRLMQHGVAVTVASNEEKANIERLAPPGVPITVVPNGVDTSANRPGDEVPIPNTLIYSGAVTYEANYDAVRYFICDVLPLVRQQIPDAQFEVTGSTGSVDIRDLSSQPGVIFTGYLPEIAPVERACWAAVVPLRQGGGTRLKILEAMALGTPVISTRKGAEGLHVQHGENILLADTPQELAQAVVMLLSDAGLRARLAQAGRVLVEREYDWSAIAQPLIQLIEQVAENKDEKRVHRHE